MMHSFAGKAGRIIRANWVVMDVAKAHSVEANASAVGLTAGENAGSFQPVKNDSESSGGKKSDPVNNENIMQSNH